MAEIYAKFTSLNDETAKDFDILETDVIIGRKKDCGHQIPNGKISGQHCQVQLDKESGEFTLTDKSTNGTFVNDKRVSKDEPVQLQNGDKIYLLKDENENEKIGFIFVSLYSKPEESKLGQRRKRSEMEGHGEDKKEESKKEQPQKKILRQDTPYAVQQMKCSFCLEIMYKPVCLIPCLHNFCGGCYADWMVKNGNCPECRDKVKTIKRNHLLNSMIEAHLKDNPKDAKVDDTKQLQDDSDCFNNEAVTLAMGKKLKKEHDKKIAEEKKNRKKKPQKKTSEEESKEDNKEEEKKKESKAVATSFRPRCRNCHKSIGGFQCDADTRHVNCAACNVAFPLTGKAGVHTRCVCCLNYFCHQHWPCSKQAINKVSPLETFPFIGIPADALNKNQYEQRVLKDYVKKKKFTKIQFKSDIFSRLEADGNWDITNTEGSKHTLEKDSSLCRRCFPDVWQKVIYWYRFSISALLPNNVQTRQDCWYGDECRTQTHKFSHAAKLNHICRPRR
ncbi:unnamed protein product [Moneuplotes crassus]|uniref:E3 ubiquitin-protein ligase CHFR n=1 Tax=Euplotes crassus TaxID=5936 RepID=A0AAD1UAX9_EUPCR|nr:unnamed protein product [Moneuplotes crassus]